MSKKKKKSSPASSSHPGATVHPAAGSSSVLGRENPEPVAEPRPMPILPVVLLGLLVWWGEMFVMEHGGDLAGKSGRFPSSVYYPYQTFAEVVKANPVDAAGARRANGQVVFNAACSACHQPSGLGLTGQFPPLAGSEWVLAEGPNRIIRIVLNGMIGPIDVKGQQFNNNMVAWKDTYNDQQIADVLTYVRSEWGNKAAPVMPEQVKKIRAQVADRTDYWTSKELEAVPFKD